MSHPTQSPATARLRATTPAWLLLGLLAVTLALPAWQAHAAEPEARVVYHADFADPRRFSAMLTSINNMVVHYENQLTDHDIRIVFVAHGIRFLTDAPMTGTPFAEDEALAAQRENLKGRLGSLVAVHGVRLELCDITRGSVNLDRDALHEGVTLVPSGVVRIAELQNREGFAYIKIE
ncbi:DsrE family protein [Ectothiorhodospira lacustris]|uniref:DsrE family protein n=1 Tax=Ectothiorhodospira lacustris TaxID=2899127 RepID=UPI001EE990D0|nr:DsrE family protein [Ectothiorhodospira lacustris]MCG5501354.1 DsrE family protein [Ectothiorhodospira lacustris]MCG5510758.1 DsrE family protein [Ectothiorhodospira lacustris]MCG5522490.1 DsrE family protein [Ectothiorhodospira lacustris]